MKLQPNWQYLERLAGIELTVDRYLAYAIKHNDPVTMYFPEWWCGPDGFNEYPQNQRQGIKEAIRQHLRGKPYQDTHDGSGIVLGP